MIYAFALQIRTHFNYKSILILTFLLKIRNFHKKYDAYIYYHLSWKNYIKITNSKISKAIGIVRKMREFLQEKQSKNLYNVFMKPYTEYGNFAWGGAPTTYLNQVSRSHKKAVRVMRFRKKHESTKPLFEYLSTVPFDFNIKLQQGKFRKQLSLDLQPNSITKQYSFRYTEYSIRAWRDRMRFQTSLNLVWLGRGLIRLSQFLHS